MPALGEMVPAPVRAMPRFAVEGQRGAHEEGAAAEGQLAGVAEPGAVPRPLSAAIEMVPALMVVMPV